MVSLRQRNNDSKGLYFAFLVWFGFFSSSHKELTIVLSEGKNKYHGLQHLVTPFARSLAYKKTFSAAEVMFSLLLEMQTYKFRIRDTVDRISMIR